MIIAKNDRRTMVEEYGPYMNLRIAIYDNTGTLEVWFSNLDKAKEWWAKNWDRPTYRENQKGLKADLVLIDEELPFM